MLHRRVVTRFKERTLLVRLCTDFTSWTHQKAHYECAESRLAVDSEKEAHRRNGSRLSSTGPGRSDDIAREEHSLRQVNAVLAGLNGLRATEIRPKACMNEETMPVSRFAMCVSESKYALEDHRLLPYGIS